MRISVKICGLWFHVLVDGDAVTFATFAEPPHNTMTTMGHPVELALRAYAEGDLAALDTIKVRQPGSPFRSRIWAELRNIAPGKPISYGELADIAGRPKAIRAAASGCATNQIPLIVPCHRVVRKDGTLGGYAFGVDIKTRLLRHEATHSTR